MAIANDTESYMPPVFLRKFESDISPLMGFTGDEGDYLLSWNGAYINCYDYWNDLGFIFPSVVGIDEILSMKEVDIDFISPWGWSRAVHRVVEPLKQFCGQSFVESPVSSWKESYREFYNRKTSILFMSNVKEQTKYLDYISIPYKPIVVKSFEDVSIWMGKNSPPYVLKTPWSSSGRGLYLISSEEFINRSETWVKSRLKQQKELIIEPWLNKVQDFSFQFYIHSDGEIDFLGINYFEAGIKGNFIQEFIGYPECLSNSMAIKRLPNDWVYETAGVLKKSIEKK